jgi:hypothetical protein
MTTRTAAPSTIQAPRFRTTRLRAVFGIHRLPHPSCVARMPMAPGDWIAPQEEEGLATVAADLDELLAPGAIELAAWVEQVGRSDHALLQRPIFAAPCAIASIGIDRLSC